MISNLLELLYEAFILLAYGAYFALVAGAFVLSVKVIKKVFHSRRKSYLN